MEDLLAILGGIGETNHDEEGESIDSHHSPKPIRAMGDQVEVTRGRVDLKGIIRARNEDTHFDGFMLERLGEA